MNARRLATAVILLAATGLLFATGSPDSALGQAPALERAPACGQPSPGVCRGDPAPREIDLDGGDHASHRADGDIPLGDSALRDLVQMTRDGIAGPTELNVVGESVRVEILHNSAPETIRALVASLGGNVYGEVPPTLAEALVPIGRLVELEATAEVQYLRPPLRVNIPIDEPSTPNPAGVRRPSGASFTGQEVGKMNADDWHAAGFTGQGVKVGIIDSFDAGYWNAAQSAGEVPAPSGTFCRSNGSACDIWASQSQHGEGVAEVIHEMAPDAQLYLANVWTTADLQAAVNYFGSAGVSIISRSQTAMYDGPGDGTGPIANVVNNAISQGMIWANSAGNSAGGDGWTGSYWRGPWSDTDFDGYLNFDGGTELLPFGCGFLNGVRWSDWGSNPTDYDIYVYDNDTDQVEKVSSRRNQAVMPPIENVLEDPAYGCTDSSDVDFLAVELFAAGNGTGNDTIEFMTNTDILQQWSNPYSASGPMTDSSNPGMLTVGAVDPALGTTIAGYSSWGPTNDGRMKPDLSAAACVDSYTYYPDCFNGTSSSTPAVAGAAALVLGAGQANSPAGLANYLRDSTVDRGAGGPDNVYGHGEVILGAPPTGGPASRTWGDVDCDRGTSTRDNQALLRRILQQNPLSQTEPCPDIGTNQPVEGFGSKPWGDLDCDMQISTRDNQALLRRVLQQNALSQTEPCPDIGTTVTVGAGGPTNTPTATPVPTNTATPTATATPTVTPTSTPDPRTECNAPGPGIPIPDNDLAGAELYIDVPEFGEVTDIDLCINIDHSWIGDLIVLLTHEDTGTSVLLIDQPGYPASEDGCSGNDIRVLLDDQAAAPVENQCAATPPAINGIFWPSDPLSAFNGEELSGTWTVTVVDVAAPDAGQVLGVALYYEWILN